MYLMIDNYDSFVYNLRAYFEELGKEIIVKRSDRITMEEIEEMQPEGIILSPGPKRPWDAAVCVETVRRFQGRIPILGVCLGHQVLGFCSGATVEKGKHPMHGKVTGIVHNGKGLFKGLPERFKVTRYHSLIVKEKTVPKDYRIDLLQWMELSWEFHIEPCHYMGYSFTRRQSLQSMDMNFWRISVK